MLRDGGPIGRKVDFLCVFTIHHPPYELTLSQIRRRGPGSPPNRYPWYVLTFCPKFPLFNRFSSSDGLHQPERTILGRGHRTGKGNNTTKKPTNCPADHLDRQLVPVCGSEGVPVPRRGENPDNPLALMGAWGLTLSIQKRLSHELGLTPVEPRTFELVTNHRSHSGIVNCARSIVKLILQYWPHSIDALKPEQTTTPGFRPIFFTGKEDVRLFL